MNQLLMAALTYASAIILLTESFYLLYRSTKVPNFALGTIMTIGAYVSYSCKEIIGLPVNFGYSASFIIGSLILCMVGVLVLEPLIKKGRSLIEITLATIGLGILIEGLIQIYHEYIKVPHTNIMLRTYDFRVGEVSGVFPLSTLLAIFSFLLLRHLFQSARFGCSLRAMWENVDLVQIQGINPIRIRFVIWVLAGGLAGLAGGVMTMWFHITPISGSWIMQSIFAAALLGGFDSLRGAFLGGLLVGLGEIMLVTWGQAIIGVWVGEYRFLVTFLIIVLVLKFSPNGLFGHDIKEESWKRIAFWRRLNKKYLLVSIIFLIFIGAMFVNTCNMNREKAREELFSEFDGYGLEVRERETGATRFHLGNLTVFQDTLYRLNISKVYVEPYGSGTTFNFYFLRNGNYWVTTVRLRYYGLCQFKPV